MRYVLGFACVLALAVVACREASGTGGNGGTGAVGGDGGDGGAAGGWCDSDDPYDCCCQRPLDDYCECPSCPTWEQAVAAAEKSASYSGCYCDDLWGFAAAAGRCGELRYVLKDCADVEIEYFDSSGALVARSYSTDCDCIECGPDYYTFCIDYGPVPECELEQEQDFCAQLPELVCRAWCANEPRGSSCYQGPTESIPDCYQHCLDSYTEEEEQSGCGLAWIRIKSCELAYECELPSASSCEWWEDRLALCQAVSYCEANCPTQDRDECIEEYLAEEMCNVGAFEMQP